MYYAEAAIHYSKEEKKKDQKILSEEDKRLQEAKKDKNYHLQNLIHNDRKPWKLEFKGRGTGLQNHPDIRSLEEKMNEVLEKNKQYWENELQNPTHKPNLSYYSELVNFYGRDRTAWDNNEEIKELLGYIKSREVPTKVFTDAILNKIFIKYREALKKHTLTQEQKDNYKKLLSEQAQRFKDVYNPNDPYKSVIKKTYQNMANNTGLLIWQRLTKVLDWLLSEPTQTAQIINDDTSVYPNYPTLLFLQDEIERLGL
jgi:hypothetical protein